MNNKKKRLTGLFLALVMLTLTLFAIPVSAAEKELSEEAKTALAQSAEAYVAQLCTMDDASLETVREYGGFYEVLVDAWMDNREELGDYVGLISDSVDTTDENVYVTMMTEFTNYNAEVVMYFDETATTPMNFVINTQYSLGEKIAQAGVNTITGILIVFCILLFLAFLISLFKYVNPDARRKKAAPAPAPAAAPAAAPKKAAPAPVAETVEVASNDEEIIAVIAAAIAAAEADGTATGDSYVVRSIKRVGNTRSWKRA